MFTNGALTGIPHHITMTALKIIRKVLLQVLEELSEEAPFAIPKLFVVWQIDALIIRLIQIV